MYTPQGKKCSVCEMLQPFQPQGASFETHACGPGDHGIASDRDKPLATCDILRGSAPTQGPVGRRMAVPTPAWVLAAHLALAGVPCVLPCNGDKPKREVQSL